MRVLPLLFASIVTIAMAMPAEAAKKKKNSGLLSQSVASQDAATEKLNQQSLNMARGGQNVPTGGADTTGNLNAMSGAAAAAGRSMNAAPMPFR
jgi:hypothetical protein